MFRGIWLLVGYAYTGQLSYSSKRSQYFETNQWQCTTSNPSPDPGPWRDRQATGKWQQQGKTVDEQKTVGKSVVWKVDVTTTAQAV